MIISISEKNAKIKYGENTFIYPLNSISYAIDEQYTGLTLFRNNERIGTSPIDEVTVDGVGLTSQNIDELLLPLFSDQQESITLPIEIADVNGLQNELDNKVSFDENGDINLIGKNNIILDKNKEILGIASDDTQHVLVKMEDYTLSKTLKSVQVGDELTDLTLRFPTSLIPTGTTNGVCRINGAGNQTLEFHKENSIYAIYRLVDGVTEQRPYEDGWQFSELELYDFGVVTSITWIDGVMDEVINNITVTSIADQVEIGSESIHLNLNSIDRPTIELTDRKEEVAYLSDISDNLEEYLKKNSTESQGSIYVTTDNELEFISKDEDNNNSKFEMMPASTFLEVTDDTGNSRIEVTQSSVILSSVEQDNIELTLDGNTGKARINNKNIATEDKVIRNDNDDYNTATAQNIRTKIAELEFTTSENEHDVDYAFLRINDNEVSFIVEQPEVITYFRSNSGITTMHSEETDGSGVASINISGSTGVEVLTDGLANFTKNGVDIATITGAKTLLVLTQAEYDAVVTKDNNTIYFIKE